MLIGPMGMLTDWLPGTLGFWPTGVVVRRRGAGVRYFCST